MAGVLYSRPGSTVGGGVVSELPSFPNTDLRNDESRSCIGRDGDLLAGDTSAGMPIDSVRPLESGLRVGSIAAGFITRSTALSSVSDNAVSATGRRVGFGVPSEDREITDGVFSGVKSGSPLGFASAAGNRAVESDDEYALLDGFATDGGTAYVSSVRTGLLRADGSSTFGDAASFDTRFSVGLFFLAFSANSVRSFDFDLSTGSLTLGFSAGKTPPNIVLPRLSSRSTIVFPRGSVLLSSANTAATVPTTPTARTTAASFFINMIVSCPESIKAASTDRNPSAVSVRRFFAD